MSEHVVTIRMESRAGMVRPDYRLTCSKCGWVDKAGSQQDADVATRFHERTGR